MENVIPAYIMISRMVKIALQLSWIRAFRYERKGREFESLQCYKYFNFIVMKQSKKCYKHEKPFILKHNPGKHQIDKYCLSKCSKTWYKRLLKWNFSWMSRGYNPKNYASELYPFIWRKME